MFCNIPTLAHEPGDRCEEKPPCTAREIESRLWTTLAGPPHTGSDGLPRCHLALTGWELLHSPFDDAVEHGTFIMQLLPAFSSLFSGAVAMTRNTQHAEHARRSTQHEEGDSVKRGFGTGELSTAHLRHLGRSGPCRPACVRTKCGRPAIDSSMCARHVPYAPLFFSCTTHNEWQRPLVSLVLLTMCAMSMHSPQATKVLCCFGRDTYGQARRIQQATALRKPSLRSIHVEGKQWQGFQPYTICVRVCACV